MKLPFSDQQFFDLFGRYNTRVWPMVVLLWIVTLWFAVQLVRRRSRSVGLSAILALHWVWSGVVYHASFFTAINPAAWLFAVLFVVESGIFICLTITRAVQFAWGQSRRHKVAGVLIAYSLAYPVLVLAFGHDYPRAPLFAVPCPTTLFTCGVLLTAVPRVPVVASVVPVMWSLIAGSAAILLEVAPDAMLFIAGGAVATAAIAQRRRRAPPLLVTAAGARRP